MYFVHSGLYYGLFTGHINKFIHPFYVNAFFIVSGYLFFLKYLSPKFSNQNKKSFLYGGGNALINNVLYRLAIPTVLFSTMEFFPSHLLRGHEFTFSTFMYKTLGGCTYWFTSALVVVQIVMYLLLLTRKKTVWFYFLCSGMLFVLGRYWVENDISLFLSYPSLPWQYKHGIYALIFFAFGGLYWRYESIIIKMMNKYVLFIMTIIYATALLLCPDEFCVLVSMLDVNIPGIFLGLLSTIILIEFCKFMPMSKLLNYLGNNTLGLYFMSGALPIVSSMVVNKFLPTNFYGLMIVFVGSLTFALVAVYLINKFTPWLFDLRLLWKKQVITNKNL